MVVQQQGILDAFLTRPPFSEHDLEPSFMNQEPPDFGTLWNHSPLEIFEDSDSTASVSHLEEVVLMDPGLRTSSECRIVEPPFSITYENDS